MAGFFHTGDLAERDQRGRYAVLGRVKTALQLAGNKIIVPDYVEGVFMRSKFVKQVLVYANASYPRPVAIVVVNPMAVATWFGEAG